MNNYEIIEGLAKVKVATEIVPTKKMPVFYNPVMKKNRDLTILLLKATNMKDMRLADPLAASGIRALRLMLELGEERIEYMAINDGSESAVKAIKNNLELNSISTERVTLSCMDANDFLLQSKGFDYIDIDPFGTPNPFLDSAIKRLSRKGILAVTATDTAPLCGTYPKPCRRKYWAEPLRCPVMHEIGIRILIRKIQLVGMQYDKALTPILSYADEHYLRVFLRCEKSKNGCDMIHDNHLFFHICKKCLKIRTSNKNTDECCGAMQTAGPMWAGNLWNSELLDGMLLEDNSREYREFLSLMKGESLVDVVGFYNLSSIVSRHKLGLVPKTDSVITELILRGFRAARSHFGGVRSDANINDVIEAIIRTQSNYGKKVHKNDGASV